MGSRRRGNGEKVQGKRSTNGNYKIDGEVKNSMGNGEAKELICITDGHELRWGNDGGKGGTRWKVIKGRRNGTTVIA